MDEGFSSNDAHHLILRGIYQLTPCITEDIR